MDVMPFSLVFLQSTPETVLLVSLGLILIGIKPRLLPILLISFITAFASYYLRALPLAPGISILLQFPILIALIICVLKLPLIYTLLASSLGLICISLAETVFNILILLLTGISAQEAMTNFLWRLIYPLPEFAFLTLIILLLNHFGKALFNLSELSELESIDTYEEHKAR